MRHPAWPRKEERQAGDRLGHTGLSESQTWDSDDTPSLQHLLSGALELHSRKEGLNCDSRAKWGKHERGQRDVHGIHEKR